METALALNNYRGWRILGRKASTSSSATHYCISMRFYHVLAFHYKARSAHILLLSKQKLIFAGAWGCFSWNVLWQHILSNHRCWPKGVQARETRGQTVTCKSIGQWVHLLFTMELSGSKIPGWFLRTRRAQHLAMYRWRCCRSDDAVIKERCCALLMWVIGIGIKDVMGASKGRRGSEMDERAIAPHWIWKLMN